MSKIILVLICIILLSSCDFKIRPDGKDEKGYFIYEDKCISTHSEEYKRFTGKFWVTHTHEVCDSTVVFKTYLNPKEVKEGY